jgi:hypothetical protein
VYNVYECIAKFKCGRKNVTHEEEAGRLSTSTNDEKILQARQKVLLNRRVAVDEVACSLQISPGFAFQIIHDELGFHKICARWVPRQLTAKHKRKRVEICQRLFDRYNNEGEEFFSRIDTGEEQESKRRSTEWKHPGLPAKEKFKFQPPAGKVMLTLLGLKRAYTRRLPGKEAYDQQ